MIFYNGFNLLVDFILIVAAYSIGKYVGYRQGEEDNSPPFWFDTHRKVWCPPQKILIMSGIKKFPKDP